MSTSRKLAPSVYDAPPGAVLDEADPAFVARIRASVEQVERGEYEARPWAEVRAEIDKRRVSSRRR